MATKTRQFTSERKHTRLDFSPLTIACELVCTTPDSPVAQTANTALGQYEPDRTVSPTIIRPQVTVIDPDGIYSSGINNRNLSTDNHVWKVNGKAIASVWKEGTDYSIIKDATDDNGSLKVMKNLVAGGSAALSYEGKFNDFRTGTNYVVSASGMALTTTNKGDDVLQCMVDCDKVSYDPIEDRLLLYDYMIAQGSTKMKDRSTYVDGKSYERTVTVTLTSGTSTLTAVPSGLTMRLVGRGSTTAIVPSSLDHPEVKSVAFPSVVFDLRWLWSGEYEVQFVNAKGEIKARADIAVTREMSKLTQYEVARGNDIAPSQQRYYNEGIFAVAGKPIAYPELYYDIQWWTQAREYNGKTYTYADRIDRQTGVSMECSVDSLGIGHEKELCWFDVAMDIEERGVSEVLTDGDGAVLTDENGYVLFF